MTGMCSVFMALCLSTCFCSLACHTSLWNGNSYNFQSCSEVIFRVFGKLPPFSPSESFWETLLESSVMGEGWPPTAAARCPCRGRTSRLSQHILEKMLFWAKQEMLSQHLCLNVLHYQKLISLGIHLGKRKSWKRSFFGVKISTYHQWSGKWLVSQPQASQRANAIVNLKTALWMVLYYDCNDSWSLPCHLPCLPLFCPLG